MVPRIIFTPDFISARCYKELLDITDSILSWYVVRVGFKRLYMANQDREILSSHYWKSTSGLLHELFVGP